MENPKFLGGVVKASDLATLPLDELPRVAFAGRSNVGKSSLLNALTNSKIARVSGEPGKTREMNFFRFCLTRDPKDVLLLVDLPGYGYAKVARTLRDQWGREITTWLKGDEDLALVVALVDGRHGFLDNDLELVKFLVGAHLPFIIAFTKMDKYKSNNQRKQAEKQLTDLSSSMGVDRFIFVSAFGRDGVRPLENVLKEILKESRAVG
ncbi:MAG: ribosome biogenesis GTP-binding protein YsxC [Deltaproteobacteria bacterium]|nr:ribosome biogenesis GTP-binding protein YsxC [Deltaproteobacteria bacterium]